MGDCLTEGTVLSTYEEFPAIDAANRYFTPKGIVAPDDIRPLTAEVDPRGSLSKAAVMRRLTGERGMSNRGTAGWARGFMGGLVTESSKACFSFKDMC